jgi:thymidylate synthase (FAD)
MDEITFRSDSTVELIDHMGNDQRVVRAARVSTGLDLREADDQSTTGLIKYLMKNRHGSPFEKGVFEFRVECPIFVAREFMRHRIASYNEESARYKKLDAVFWVPAAERPLVQEGKPGHYVMKQGTKKQNDYAVKILTETAEHCYESYELLLQEGIAREVARACLTVGIYTSFYVTMNARSLMNFLSLRVNDPNALFPTSPQWEIESAAIEMEQFFQRLMPVTYQAFIRSGRVSP